MESSQTTYRNPGTGYSNISNTNTGRLPPLPVTRKRPLDQELETDLLIQQSNQLVEPKSRSSGAAHRTLPPQKKHRGQNTEKMTSVKSFDLQDLVPYYQYRARQRSEKQGEGESVWDEETEKAFMDGLKEVPRLGRRKLSVNGKPCGRNELIAAYIYKATGKLRTRKQVSSHIQVLKNLLRNNKEFMDMVSADDKVQAWDEDLSGLAATKTNANRYSTSTLGSQSSGSPNYHPVNDPYDQHAYLSQHTLSSRQTLVRPSKFSMWVGSTLDTSSSEPSELAARQSGCVHTYTHLFAEDTVLSPMMLQSLKSWQSRFPYAAEVQQEGYFDCPIISF